MTDRLLGRAGTAKFLTGVNRKTVQSVLISILVGTAALTLFCSGEASGKDQAPGELSPAKPEQLQQFQKSPEENLQSTRWDYGSTTISNEMRLDLYRPYIDGIGGGYVGVGSTQNLLLGAWANSQWIWMVDFTRIVVAANRVHLAFIKESDTPQAYQRLWHKGSQKRALEILKKYYSADPEYKFIVRKGYRMARRFVNTRYRLLLKLSVRDKQKIWLNDAELYGRIYRLARANRIRALKGDLNGEITLRGIGRAARQMGVPIRILYTSNAEEYKIFRPYPKSFRLNIGNMPADPKGVVLRTVSISRWKYPWAPGWDVQEEKIGFHYNVQSLQGFQKGLAEDPACSVLTILKGSKMAARKGLSLNLTAPKPKEASL